MNSFPEKPFPASYWLKPDQIAAGELPTSTNEVEASEKIESLLRAGIETYINLLEINEFEKRAFVQNSYPDYTFELKEGGNKRGLTIECIRFPIVDFGIPSEPEMIDILNCIDDNLANQRKVYFHCYAGLGRTGTVAGCWLVRHGMEGDEALRELYNIRHAQGTTAYGISPQSSIQLDFVGNWKQGQ